MLFRSPQNPKTPHLRFRFKQQNKTSFLISGGRLSLRLCICNLACRANTTVSNLREMSFSFRGDVLELIHLEELAGRVNYQLILNILMNIGLIKGCSFGVTFVTLQWWHSIIPRLRIFLLSLLSYLHTDVAEEITHNVLDRGGGCVGSPELVVLIELHMLLLQLLINRLSRVLYPNVHCFPHFVLCL